MKAIITKRSAGNRGTRYSARDLDNNSVRVDVPSEVSWVDGGCHLYAAMSLCRKMGWQGEIVGGALPGGQWAFVFTEGRNTCRAVVHLPREEQKL